MTSILLRNISISHSYQDLATRTGMRGGQKRYVRTSRRNTSGNIFTAKSETEDGEEKLKYALQALELILCDEGLAKHNGVNIPEYAGCEYCNGVTEWSEKLGADGKEVRFEFCPVCGRMIEEG